MAGRSRNKRAALSRRHFLKRMGLASAVVGGGTLSACGNSPQAGGRSGEQGENPFKHGVASGDPQSDRVILWTRISSAASGAVAVRYVVARDTELEERVLEGEAQAHPDRDYTIKVDAAGLDAGTSYYYRFSAEGWDSPVGRTRTAPSGSLDRLRVGVVSCASYAHGYFNAYRRLADRSDIDVVLHLGDYIYEYGTGEYGEVREYQPAAEILTLEDYRTRHGYYKLDADLQEVHRQHPFITVWDDHETADKSWRDGASNHTEGDEGVWAQRKAWGIQAYYEWLPIREVEAGRPERIYRSFRYGDLADFVMLDTRLIARDEQAGLLDASSINDEARELLGSEQRGFLNSALADSGVAWKILGQQVMFGQLRIPSLPELSVLTGLPIPVLEDLLSSLPIVSTGGLIINTDQWDGYRAERARVFDMIEALALDNVVVLTGDIHTSWGMDLTPDPANPLVYNPLNGNGSLGTEFVCTSVTSPGLEAAQSLVPLLKLLNPHMKYVDLAQKGYLLLDITQERVQGEWWYVDTVLEPSEAEFLGAAYAVASGSRHLVESESATEPRDSAAALAP